MLLRMLFSSKKQKRVENTTFYRFLFFLAITIYILFLVPNSNAIYMGTCEGYVHYLNGSLVNGANIHVEVVGCSGDGCSGTDVSDANGYYAVANLNIPSGGQVIVTGNLGNAYGINVATANEYYAAEANITLCEPPSKPTIMEVNDTHFFDNFTLSWSSGSDPNGYSTYDQFNFNGVYENATSPKIKEITSFSLNSWGARTCNPGCCSDWSSDSFNVYNYAPSKPNLTLMEPTSADSLSFEWDSGVDPDGDATYDEFQLSNTSDFSNILTNGEFDSPHLESNLDSPQILYWRVRTCDEFDYCSSWEQDSFFVYPVETIVVSSGGGSCSGGGSGGILIREPRWECSEWSECNLYGIKSRECQDTAKVSSISSFIEMETCFELPSCDDKIKNGNEEGIDCGGVCKPCSIPEKIIGGFTQPRVQYPLDSCELSGYYWLIILLLILLFLSWAYFIAMKIKEQQNKR